MKPHILIFSPAEREAQPRIAALRTRYPHGEVALLAPADLLADGRLLGQADLVVVIAGGGAEEGAWHGRLKQLASVPLLLLAEQPDESMAGYLPLSADEQPFLAQVRLLLRLKESQDELGQQQQRLKKELDRRSMILRETEHRFRVIFEASPDAVFVEDENGIVLDVNPAACRLHGRSKNRLVGVHVSELVPPAQRNDVIRDFPLWFSGALQVYEGFSYREDGKIIPVEIKASRIEYQDRPALLLIARDVSERRSGEDRRTATVQGLRAIVDIADDLIACPDSDTLYRKAVELARERLGLERAAIFLCDGRHALGTFGTNAKGQTTDERSHRIPLDDTWRDRFRLRAPNEPRWSLSLEHLQDWQDGAMRPRGPGWVAITPIQTASTSMGVFFNDSALTHASFDPVKQEIVAVYCSLLANIMQRKSAEIDRGRLAMAVEQSAEAVLIADLNGTITYVNPAFERITGYAARDVLGLNPRILKSGRHDFRFYERMWNRLREGEVWTGRITNRRKDGTFYEAEQTTSPLRDRGGVVVGYLTVSQDVTRSIKLENELRQAQKMDSIGRLAGGVAHDFNNLLTGILGFAKVVMEELGPGHPSLPDLEEIVRAGERAAKLTRQLLAFGHQQVLQIQALDLNTVVVNMHAMLRRTLGEDVELVTAATDPLGRIEADAGLLEQVIINLAVNARDAMPKGGKLIVRTDNIVVDEALTQRHPEANPGHYVLLAVADNGAGMTEEVKQQAFEPFYTTKEKGRGLGLGLSTVYGIVKQFGGFVELDSALGAGTEVRLYFPASTPPAAPPKEKVVEKAAGKGGETILVVEDENTVRHLTVRILKGLGYQVLEARNGDEALSLFEQHPGLDLVLTDVVMPRMGGPELAGRLHEKAPGLKILFMSGYTEDMRMEGTQGDQSTALILKPFTRDSMAAAIRGALDAR